MTEMFERVQGDVNEVLFRGKSATAVRRLYRRFPNVVAEAFVRFVEKPYMRLDVNGLVYFPAVVTRLVVRLRLLFKTERRKRFPDLRKVAFANEKSNVATRAHFGPRIILSHRAAFKGQIFHAEFFEIAEDDFAVIILLYLLIDRRKVFSVYVVLEIRGRSAVLDLISDK